jgi:hypothetical protein
MVGAEPTEVGALVASLRTLYPVADGQQVDLVIESACVPVILVDTGGVIWSPSQIDALVRHHLGLHYDDGLEKVATWTIRADHRAGERYALACGIPPLLLAALETAAREVSLKWATTLPALTVGWQRRRRAGGVPLHTGWFVWQEQDRSLVARVDRGRVTGLNAAAPRFENADDVDRLIRTESFRLGLAEGNDPVNIGSWDALGSDTARMQNPTHRWLTIGAHSESLGHAAARPASTVKAVA